MSSMQIPEWAGRRVHPNAEVSTRKWAHPDGSWAAEEVSRSARAKTAVRAHVSARTAIRRGRAEAEATEAAAPRRCRCTAPASFRTSALSMSNSTVCNFNKIVNQLISIRLTLLFNC